MKKKLISMLLILSSVMSFAACNAASVSPQPVSEIPEPSEIVSEIPSEPVSETPSEPNSEIKSGKPAEVQADFKPEISILLNNDISDLNAISQSGNFIYSPLSMRTALDIYAQFVTDEDVKENLSDFIYNEDYLAYNYDKESYKSVNRIWVNKNKEIEIPETLKNFVYEMDMSDAKKATDEKNTFVNKQTNGFINQTPSVLNSDVRYDVMNVLYFKDKYAEKPTVIDYDIDFKNSDGSTSNPEFIMFDIDKYYKNDTAIVAPIEYEDGNVLLMIKPLDGIENVNLNGIFDEAVYEEAYVYYPLFKSENSFILNDIMPQLVENTPNIDTTIMQIAKIEVDKEGTTAAAVTEVLTTDACVAEPEEPAEIYFDSEFYYAIKDTENDDIAFIGRISDL